MTSWQKTTKYIAMAFAILLCIGIIGGSISLLALLFGLGRGGETAELPVLGDDVEAQLTAPTPYDRMYPLYLAAQVDRLNGELGKYNNSITLFMTAYGEYRNWSNRTHESVGASVKYW